MLPPNLSVCGATFWDFSPYIPPKRQQIKHFGSVCYLNNIVHSYNVRARAHTYIHMYIHICMCNGGFRFSATLTRERITYKYTRHTHTLMFSNVHTHIDTRTCIIYTSVPRIPRARELVRSIKCFKSVAIASEIKETPPRHVPTSAGMVPGIPRPCHEICESFSHCYRLDSSLGHTYTHSRVKLNTIYYTFIIFFSYLLRQKSLNILHYFNIMWKLYFNF